MKFGAVYCLYDDVEYLEASLEPVEDKLDVVLFLISDIPWNGKKCDNRLVIEKVKDICSRNKKFKIIEGHWTNEVDQRNFGLEHLYSIGVDYCFVIDTDEIYHARDFQNIKKFILQNPGIVAFHIEWNTYWTKRYYVISPREYYRPLIAVKIKDFKFTDIRHGITSVTRVDKFILETKEKSYNGIVIPPNIGICFHLSYARTNEYIKRKLETNSHAPEFINNWYENTWLKWRPESRNLHPVTPRQYEKAVKEDFIVFPESLKKVIKKERRKCSIIIVNWNSFDLLVACLEKIEKNTNNIEYSVIIIDNGSEDAQKIEELKSKFSKISKVIYNAENFGFPRAVNQGIKFSDRDSDVCIMNVDAEPEENWLECLYETLETRPDSGVIGPLGNEIENGYQKERMVDEDTKVFNLHFYCVLIFREVIEKIGLLDERFGIGGYEDNDFCIRAGLAGYECWISAKSLVRHKAHQVFKKNGIDNFQIEEKNKVLLQKKLIQTLYEYGKYFDLYKLSPEIASCCGLNIKE